MSWFAIAYAETAPVVDVYERSILTLMAHRADHDGTGCWPSIPTMAEYACCDDKTIERRLAAMRRRKVIAYGNQKLVRHLPADKRPKVYDILIPYDWYSAAQIVEVDRDREKRGMPPLPPESRPPLEPVIAKGRKARSDKGKPRKPASAKKDGSPSSEAQSGEPGGLTVPPVEEPAERPTETDGGSNSPPARGLTVPSRGVYKTPKTVHPPTGENSPGEISPLGGETPPPKPPRTENGGPSESVVVYGTQVRGDQQTACARIEAQGDEAMTANAVTSDGLSADDLLARGLPREFLPSRLRSAAGGS